MRGLAEVVALCVIACASQAHAQRNTCTDDTGRDRCEAEAQQKQLNLYGVDALDELGAKGAQIVRAFFVDGYGRDAGLVSFVRGPAFEPRVEWRLPRPDGVAGPRATMTGIASLATWEALQADGKFFDRLLAPQSDGVEPTICLHGWMVRVETVDARGKSRRNTQGSCDSGLTVQYGFKIARAAVETLPSCALLDPERTRNDVTRLSECTLLDGDRAAAAEALNVFNTPWFTNPRGPDFARALQYLFHDRAELSWPGQPPVNGSEAASRLWSEHAARDRFFLSRVYGETSDRVRIEGTILFAESQDGKERRVPAAMIWTRENGFGFRLRSLISGPPGAR